MRACSFPLAYHASHCSPTRFSAGHLSLTPRGCGSPSLGDDAFRAQLESQAPPLPEGVDRTEQPLTGEELRGLVVGRWGRSYDTRITQRRSKVNQLKLYLQVRKPPVTRSFCDHRCSVVTVRVSLAHCSQLLEPDASRWASCSTRSRRDAVYISLKHLLSR